MVIELGMQALRHLGLHINRHRLSLQIAREIAYGMVLFRNSRLEAIKNAPIVTDKRLTRMLEILNIMVASAYMTDENLFALIVLKIGNLSARYSNSLYSPGLRCLQPDFGHRQLQKADKLRIFPCSWQGSLATSPLVQPPIFASAAFWYIGLRQESLNYLQGPWTAASGQPTICTVAMR